MSGNTVFIVGAGASKEAKLPAGDEFKSDISRLLDLRFEELGRRLEHGDHLIVEALRINVRQSEGRGDINPYLFEAWHIRDALPQAISIDNFIDAHRDNDKIALCGKLAIVRSILSAEKKSLLYIDESLMEPKIKISSLKSTWYIPFFQLLTENCGKNDLQERFESITLIIFNYDRCVEHFIFYALQNYYRVSKAEAAELVKSINIYHPYGDVGTLNGRAMRFGTEPSAEQLLELSQKIKTYAEGTDPESSEILEIREHMGMADQLVFLGFAFHKLNMQLITPGDTFDQSSPMIKCFATTYGISENDKVVIKEQINELYRFEAKVSMGNLTCSDFFTEYWRSLSF